MKTKNSHINRNYAKRNGSKAETIQYVLPLGNGWVVKNSKATKFTVITDTKREAVSIARSIAKTKQIELIIHRKDGSVERRENYMNVA